MAEENDAAKIAERQHVATSNLSNHVITALGNLKNVGGKLSDAAKADLKKAADAIAEAMKG